MQVTNIIQKIYQWLLPPTCILCLQPADSSLDLCSACCAELPWLQLHCYQCANLLTDSMAQLCGSCLKEPPPYHRTIALFTYQPPIDGWILALKFHHKLIYAQLLGELLIQQLIASYHEEDWPELIIPVPLHRMRLVERGYNQTVEIAKVISKRLKIPLNRLDCQRVKATAPQLSLPAQQRQRNVKNAFILKRPLCMQHVAIVDDVVTTGSTAKELTRLLLNNGVQRVDVWCTARA